MPSHFQAWLVDFNSLHLTFFVHLPDIFCTFAIKNQKGSPPLRSRRRASFQFYWPSAISHQGLIAVNGDKAASMLFRLARRQARRDGHATAHRNQ